MAISTAIVFLSGLLFTITTSATQIDIPPPAGSGAFGTNVYALSSGNYVVTDPSWDTAGGVADVGAVYLYSATGTLINVVTGSSSGDGVGSNGVYLLANGNYVIASPFWRNGAVAAAGALTYCNGATGCSGVVSATNSLVGSSNLDRLGSLVELPNGNYVAIAPRWSKGPISQVGAVTFCPATGCTGPVTAANSLTGSTALDGVGTDGVTILSDGDFVVSTFLWDNGAIADAGAATFCSGTSGCPIGVVSAANSSVGMAAGDLQSSVFPLPNGDYVIASLFWDNGTTANAGAVRHCSGTTGCVGPHSSANSLIGTGAGDLVGSGYRPDGAETPATPFVLLSDGDYLIVSPSWGGSGPARAGAVTYCSGTTGCTGPITTGNSLVGSTSGDRVGGSGVFALANGNYVVGTADWNNGTAFSAGAATFCGSAAGCVGPVTTANSLVGTRINERVGTAITPLSNGNYIVRSPNWRGPGTGFGAATFCGAATGCTGLISSSNSLVGSTDGDAVGEFGVTGLPDGRYIVQTRSWDNGDIANVGAVTLCPATGCTGTISPANSLVGALAGNFVGTSVTVLTNGNYVVSSNFWDSDAAPDVGAVTLCGGASGCVGPVTSSNSLIGSTPSDQVGNFPVVPLSNGNYVVNSRTWNNAAVADAGALTWCSGTTGCTGPITPLNSLVGSTANDQIGSSRPQNAFVNTVAALPNGYWVAFSPFWDSGAATDAGAVTYANGNTPTVGTLTATNSVRGALTNSGQQLRAFANPINNDLIVSRSRENAVTIFQLDAVLVQVSGRVTTPTGLNLRNAVVSLTNSQGIRRTATTSSFGVYNFSGVSAGEMYTIAVSSKRYRFAAQQLTVNGDLTDVDFTGLE